MAEGDWGLMRLLLGNHRDRRQPPILLLMGIFLYIIYSMRLLLLNEMDMIDDINNNCIVVG